MCVCVCACVRASECACVFFLIYNVFLRGSYESHSRSNSRGESVPVFLSNSFITNIGEGIHMYLSFWKIFHAGIRTKNPNNNTVKDQKAMGIDFLQAD